MGRAQDPGGDYGYDLVHQDVQEGAGRREPATGEAVPSPSPRPDAGGDYEYDEAHDF